MKLKCFKRKWIFVQSKSDEERKNKNEKHTKNLFVASMHLLEQEISVIIWCRVRIFLQMSKFILIEGRCSSTFFSFPWIRHLLFCSFFELHENTFTKFEFTFTWFYVSRFNFPLVCFGPSKCQYQRNINFVSRAIPSQGFSNFFFFFFVSLPF